MQYANFVEETLSFLLENVCMHVCVSMCFSMMVPVSVLHVECTVGFTASVWRDGLSLEV